MASTASLSPCTTLKTPAGRPASASSSAIQLAAEGSFSLGLRITQLPVAMAIGKNHSGTIAGKLNGLITPTTPERLLDREDVDVGRDVLRHRALDQVRQRAGELDDLEPAGDLAAGVGEHLAVLGGEDRGELALAAVEQLAEGEHHRLPLGDGGLAPARRRPCGRSPRRCRRRRRSASRTWRCTTPRAGSKTSPMPVGRAGARGAVDPVVEDGQVAGRAHESSLVSRVKASS